MQHSNEDREAKTQLTVAHIVEGASVKSDIFTIGSASEVDVPTHVSGYVIRDVIAPPRPHDDRANAKKDEETISKEPTEIVKRGEWVNTFDCYVSERRGILHQDSIYALHMNGDRNVYIDSPHRTELPYLHNHRLMNMHPFYWHRAFRRIASPNHHDYIPHLSKYMETLPWIKLHAHYDEYVHRNQLTQGECEHFMPTIKLTDTPVLEIDKTLGRLLANPEKNIDELRSKLTYDDASGYYCHDGVMLICSHQFMFYEGKSIKDVIHECADRHFKCRYCGEQLIFDIDDESMDFDAVQYSLIYQTIALFKQATYESLFRQVLESAIAKSINKLELDNDENYRMTVEAFTGVYLMKLVKSLETITGKNKSDLIARVKQLSKKAGWSEKDVEALTQNEDRFVNFGYIRDLIISFMERTNANDVTIVDVMMKSNSPFKDLYLKNRFAFGEIQDKMMLDINNYVSINWSSIDSECASPEHKAIGKTGLNVRGFFNQWWHEICPVNVVHEWNKDTCKHCGVNEKNVSDVYVKYEDKLSSLIMMTYKDFHQTVDQKDLIAKIMSMDAKAPSIPNIDLILADVNAKKLRQVLTDIISAGPLEEIKNTPENNIKLLNYIITESIINQDLLIFELSPVLIQSDVLFAQLVGRL